MSSIFSKARMVALLSFLTVSHYGISASHTYDYSPYRVRDTDFLTYKSALPINTFIRDLRERQRQGEEIVAVKASGGFISDTGFCQLMANFIDTEHGFLPRLKVLDLSFNRIDGVFLDRSERIVPSIRLLLTRQAFHFLDIRGNSLASIEKIQGFFRALEDDSIFTKIIWIEGDQLRKMEWVKAFEGGAFEEDIVPLVDKITSTHEAYFEKPIVYNSKFSLLGATIEESSESVSDSRLIRSWESFIRDEIGKIGNDDFSTKTLKKGAISGNRQVENRLALGKRLYEASNAEPEGLDIAFKIFLTLAQDDEVLPSIRGESFYYLSKICKDKENYEEAKEFYSEAYSLNYTRGW